MSQIVRAIDENGDWTFGAGLSNYRVNQEAVIQNLQTRIQSFIGNCFFDMGAGINWYGFLGSRGNNNSIQCSLAISALILNTQDVTGLQQLSFDISSKRGFAISYQVQSVYSVTGNSFQYDLGGFANAQ